MYAPTPLQAGYGATPRAAGYGGDMTPAYGQPAVGGYMGGGMTPYGVPPPPPPPNHNMAPPPSFGFAAPAPVARPGMMNPARA